VHLAALKLRDFRNYGRLDADFKPGFHLLLGDNAQGKTNILEAIYLLATLRSFRGVGGAQMVRHGQKGYFVGARVLARAGHEIKIYWSAAERKLSLDGQPVRRLGDYLGTLRAVVFCTEDLQLVKGTARLRRRFMDLLLTQTHPVYLPLLQRYAAALRSRNALLKQPAPDPAALEGFTRQLVEAGAELMNFRRDLLPRVAPLARAACARVAGPAERLDLEYQPSVRHDFAVELARNRARERAFRSTLLGPHRDELQLLLDGKPAGKFASDLADRRHHGRTGREAAGGIFAVAQPGARGQQPGLHDLHGRKLAAGIGSRPATVGSQKRCYTAHVCIVNER
jgi:DNA replication and repair protein RecF